MSPTTIVLVHGAGHTAAVWRSMESSLGDLSLAVNLPGRAEKGGDLAGLSVATAAKSVAADILTVSKDEDIVLVGHSVAGTLLPSVAAQLDGQVRHLVFVAGVTAAEGQLPAEVFAPGRSTQFAHRLSKLRSDYVGVAFEDLDKGVAHALDSLSFSCEPMQWRGLPSSVPRTFVRCLKDRIQSPEVQSRLIDSCGASNVIDIDTGHTPAIEAPDALARILVDIVHQT